MLLRRLSLLLALVWMALLFYLSHQPGLDAPMLFPAQDKVFHAGQKYRAYIISNKQLRVTVGNRSASAR